MDYKPGDIMNGHILGNDWEWHPVSVTTSAVASDTKRQGYWSRYSRRWVKTGVCLAILTAIAPFVLRMSEPDKYPPVGVIDLVFGAALGFVIWGTLVNFVVAIFPGAKRG